MTDILLIVSGEPKENPQKLAFAEKRFPIGVGYLISVLRKAGYRVSFLDRYLLGNVWPKNWRYDLIGIYSSTPTFPDTLRIIEKIPKGIPIAVGGPHTSFSPKSFPDRVNWIIQGEGERAILDVVSGTLPKGIWKYTRIKNLDELPTPAFDVFDPLPYLKTVNWFPGKVFNFATGRGCPFSCSFCWVRKIWGHKVTLMSAERIIEDIQMKILGKIAEYGKDIKDINKEMQLMQSSFSKMINPILDKKRKKTKKDNFEKYLR